jgi:hypothetical protein
MDRPSPDRPPLEGEPLNHFCLRRLRICHWSKFPFLPHCGFLHRQIPSKWRQTACLASGGARTTAGGLSHLYKERLHTAASIAPLDGLNQYKSSCPSCCLSQCSSHPLLRDSMIRSSLLDGGKNTDNIHHPQTYDFPPFVLEFLCHFVVLVCAFVA